MHPLFLKCSLELSPRHPGEYNGASDGLVLDIKLTSFINFSLNYEAICESRHPVAGWLFDYVFGRPRGTLYQWG